jgi:hypothetical protein
MVITNLPLLWRSSAQVSLLRSTRSSFGSVATGTIVDAFVGHSSKDEDTLRMLDKFSANMGRHLPRSCAAS